MTTLYKTDQLGVRPNKAMKFFVLFVLTVFITSCAAPSHEFSSSDIPKYVRADISSFPVRAGMTAVQVKDALHISSLDTSNSYMHMKGPFVDNPWSGFYMVDFNDAIVSKVTFYLGNMSVVVGVWVLSEK